MPASRGGKRIKVPRRGYDTGEADLDPTWNTLSSAFREIHTKNASKLLFEQLHRCAWKLVLQSHGETLYNNVLDFERAWLAGEVIGQVRTLLAPCLLVDVPADSAGANALERKAAGERFLWALRHAWMDYQLAAGMISDVLMYMDRVYCTDQRLPKTFVALVGLFRDCVLQAPILTSDGREQRTTLLSVLVHVILEQVQLERRGGLVDKNLIRSCVQMLEGLYKSEAELAEQCLYLTAFEPQFLAAGRHFYAAEADATIQQVDAGSYCRHANKRLAEELDRCRSMLSESTIPKIEEVVLEALIKNKINDIIDMPSGLAFMVDNDRYDDLALLYQLNSRVTASKSEIIKTVQKSVVDSGTAINNTALSAAQLQTDPEAPARPQPDEAGPAASDASSAGRLQQQTVAAIKWVADVLELKDKYDAICERSFQSDRLLHTALTRSFAEFINSLARCSEYISLYIDENMKKGLRGKTDQEVDVVLEKAIILLRYIRDKDLFEEYYKKHLCRRLLSNKSLSNDVEKQMISRMKIELGNNFTVKLETMFKDMALSEELTAGYRDYVSRLGDKDPMRVELSIHVLTTMTWPLEATSSHQRLQHNTPHARCIFPPFIDNVKRGFETFHSSKHSGRVLTWQANMGTADIRAVFANVPGKDGPRQRKHELNVSTYAMMILLLFNDLEPGQFLTFPDIQSKTNIPTGELARNLQSLAVAPKTRVLIKEPMSKNVSESDKFFFNDAFQSKFLKLKIGVVTAANKVEGDRERQETERRNENTRGFTIEAALVRIMKQRKELSHQQLMSEVIGQLAAKFTPDVNMIKKRIESLIEREYLERLDGRMPAAYRYLA